MEKTGKQLYPLFVISGPAAAGKSKMADRVIADFPKLNRIITCTTRKKRPGEKNGVAYHFLTVAQFKSGIKHKEFIEHAEVHGNLYGPRVEDVRKARTKGPAIIILDPQGAEKISELFPDAHCIFIMAPDDDLRARLTERSTDHADFARRMKDSEEEMRHANRWYYGCVINNANGYLDRSLRQLYAFIRENLD
ncbi:MAG TPA: guanylate kinase [Candidatus Paceibacterota bacterium]|nr:guanylate kinase [Candidatus Paceibacterota bacterium]